jgi:phosphonopyruvate decarboxylase
MIRVEAFFDAVRAHGVGFFTGVPDSLLKDFCAYVTDHTSRDQHVIAANEGGAVALATGHYLATGRPALVYMQNSGQGNAVNPLTSLADPDVFGIPMLLLVGWRGEPGRPDEPQHVKQGKITLELFGALGIDCCVLPEDEEGALRSLAAAVARMHAGQCPVAIVARAGCFGKYKLRTVLSTSYPLTREGALKLLLDSIPESAAVVATTGMTSRELFEHRQSNGGTHRADFRTVGCMGHASQIALGIALAQPQRDVVCLDGDGALIMHMGGLAIIGAQQPRRFRHLVLNNGAHDSVGGQPTAGFDIDVVSLAQACGYRLAVSASTPDEVLSKLPLVMESDGPALLEIRVNKGARPDLGRPSSTPAENKRELMAFLSST